jgi:hypothetical protein
VETANAIARGELMPSDALYSGKKVDLCRNAVCRERFFNALEESNRSQVASSSGKAARHIIANFSEFGELLA